METSKTNILESNKEIKLCLLKFKNAENKIEAIVHLREILLTLKKEKNDDLKTINFLNQIQKELNFELEHDWKNIKIHCPEIGYYGQIDECLFMENELRTSNVYAPNNTLMSTWDYINKKVVILFDKYVNLYLQNVA